MNNCKVSLLSWLWLLEGQRLAQVVGVKLLLKGLVSGLGEERLLFQNGQDPHRLLEHVDALLEIHSEVDHGPLDAFPQVLLLLQHKHMMIEELLELLVAKVDAKLLESIEVKYLEASNIQDTNECDPKKHKSFGHHIVYQKYAILKFIVNK